MVKIMLFSITLSVKGESKVKIKNFSISLLDKRKHGLENTNSLFVSLKRESTAKVMLLSMTFILAKISYVYSV